MPLKGRKVLVASLVLAQSQMQAEWRGEGGGQALGPSPGSTQRARPWACLFSGFEFLVEFYLTEFLALINSTSLSILKGVSSSQPIWGF